MEPLTIFLIIAVIILFIWNLVLNSELSSVKKGQDQLYDTLKRKASERSLDYVKNKIERHRENNSENFSELRSAVAKLGEHLGLKIAVVSQPDKVVKLEPIEEDESTDD